VSAVVALGLGAAFLVMWASPVGAVTVNDEATFRAAWSNPAETQIDLSTDITLTCGSGATQRNSATPLTLDGHGHTITPACADRPALVVLNAASVGNSSPVTFLNVTINRGNATHSVALTNSVVAGGKAANAAVSGVSQLINVDVRKRKQQHHQPRRHHQRTTPAAPVPAVPVPAVVNFTG
jgi:hypothetical protein